MSDDPLDPLASMSPKHGLWPRSLEAEYRTGPWRIGWQGGRFYFGNAETVLQLDRATLAMTAIVRAFFGHVHLSLSQPITMALALPSEAVGPFRQWLGPHDAELRTRSLRAGWITEVVIGALWIAAAFGFAE